jgi:hypothetical protein
MSMKSKLSLAALAGLVAISALATTSANAFSPLRMCDETSPRLGCGSGWYYQEEARSKRLPTPPRHQAFGSREDAMLSAGGGGGGGGGGGR